MKVAVLQGGNSLEREISLATGEACAKALLENGCDVRQIDVGPDLPQRLADFQPSVAFIALHGRGLEDGCIQGLLEFLRIPYTHSGVLASALAMNKQMAKDVLSNAGVPVCKSIVASRAEIEASHVLIPPYVVKPINEGSSLGGLYLVENADDEPPTLLENDHEFFMVEKYAPGRELSAGVLCNQKLAVSEFELSAELYDYNEKYNSLEHNRILPAELPQEIYEHCLELAHLSHVALGCRGLTRTDLRWDEKKGLAGLMVLEVNSQPGLRPNSIAGQQAMHVGIDFRNLCKRLVEDASLDR